MVFKVGTGRIVAAFVLAVVLLIVNSFILFRAVNNLIYNNSLVGHSEDVLRALGQLRASIVDAETSQRGFILTGDDRHIEPYELSVARVREALDLISTLTSDNPSHLAKLPELEKISTDRLATLDRNLQIRRASGLEGVIRAGMFGQGKAQMDRARQIIAELDAEERERLAQRTEESRASGRSALLTLGIASAIQVALFVFVLLLTIRDFRQTREHAAGLQKAHDQLEIRVKERTAELANLNQELERSNRELEDFAFVASHDLQEPLRKIQAFGDRLKQIQAPKFDEKGRDYLERMNRAAGRMHTLINDLLTFSRVSTKAKPFRQTDLNDVVSNVLDDLEERIGQTDADVEVAKLPVIDADGLQMRQLFQNLIGNALKFQKPGTKPQIRITDESGPSPNGVCRISVNDNGIGFEEKYLDRIFTPFQRLHGRNDYEGTGIGLAVCRKIVERHGGTLTAASTPGKGSTFFIALPMKQNKETQPDEE